MQEDESDRVSGRVGIIVVVIVELVAIQTKNPLGAERVGEVARHDSKWK